MKITKSIQKLLLITFLLTTSLSISQNTWELIGPLNPYYEIIQLDDGDFVISSDTDVFKISQSDFSFTSLDFDNQIGNSLTDTNSGSLGENSIGEIFRFTPNEGIFKLSNDIWTFNGLSGYHCHGGGWTELSTGRIIITKAGFLRDIYYSDNDGDNWNSVGLEDVDWSSIVVTNSGNLFASSHASGSGTKGIIKSVDNGITWNYINDLFPANSFPSNVFSFISTDLNSDLYVITDSNKIYKSIDDGLTWVFFSLTPNSLNGVLTHSENEWYFLSLDRSTIFQSSDNGITWDNITSLFPDGIIFHNIIHFETRDFILTNNGLYNREVSLLNVNDKIFDNSIKLYPNPVSNILTIKSEIIPIDKVEIYSVLGKTIKEINLDFSNINTEDLSKGLYLLRIYSEKSTTMKKLVKK